MTGWELFFLILMGLCWGSFLNVLYVRTLSGESIVSPSSKCPECGLPLLWWQNIPILSYIILKGRCYFCNKPISIRYPILELAGCFIFLFSFIKNVSIYDAIAVVMIISMFLILSMTDKNCQKISIFQTIIIVLSGFVFNRYDLLNSIIGGIVGSCFILSLIILGEKYFNKVTFGLGDIWLVGALGAVVGIDKLLLYLFYTLIFQFLLVLPQYVGNLIRTEQRKTLRYLIYFGVTCLFLYVLKNISFYGDKLLLVLVLAYLIYFAIKLSNSIIKSIKTSETLSYCPFAPAIALSCLIFLC